MSNITRSEVRRLRLIDEERLTQSMKTCFKTIGRIATLSIIPFSAAQTETESKDDKRLADPESGSVYHLLSQPTQLPESTDDVDWISIQNSLPFYGTISTQDVNPKGPIPVESDEGIGPTPPGLEPIPLPSIPSDPDDGKKPELPKDGETPPYTISDPLPVEPDGGIGSSPNPPFELPIDFAPDDEAKYLFDQSSAEVVNFSQRSQVGPGRILITGFVVSGAGGKELLIQAVGPSLPQVAAKEACPDPKITLFAGNEVKYTNDDWEDSESLNGIIEMSEAVGATPLKPGSKDAALRVSLSSGIYSIFGEGVENAAGTLLLEVYEIQ